MDWTLTLQEVFGGKLIGLDLPFASLDASQKMQVAVIGAGFTGLLSLFNIGGRFFWSSSSDALGRKLTFTIFFALGFVLYAAVPALAGLHTTLFFVLALGVIVSMNGGGFATMPAYLADMFGTRTLGAIFGRLVTAWATAGVIGPVLVNYLRERQLAAGIPAAQVYNETMYVLAGLLLLGMICNLLIRPVTPCHHRAEERGKVGHAAKHGARAVVGDALAAGTVTSPSLVAAAWIAVSAPLVAGVLVTLQQASILLH